MVTEEDVLEQLENKYKNGSAWLCDIRPASIEPLVGIISGPMCKLSQISTEEGDVLRG